MVYMKHGMDGTSIYKAWIGLKARCNNPSDKDYCKYGGRGIKVCSRWLESFEDFYADMGDRPTPQHSIDRINVDGDYEPDNCRWADKRTQSINRRISITNKTGHRGVMFSKRKKNPYYITMVINGKNTYCGSFPTFEEAKMARIVLEREHWHDNNS